jgi:hypothetical protein
MTRTIGTLALAAALVTARSAPAGADPPLDPHIRSSQPELVAALAAGRRGSATLRALADRIDASDLVVYLVRERPPDDDVAARTRLVAAAGGRRYVLVAIDPKYGGCRLLSLLGHELRHAVEIADEPSVVDAASLAALYRRIGFSLGRGGAERYESEPAIDAGARVMREVSADRSR